MIVDPCMTSNRVHKPQICELEFGTNHEEFQPEAKRAKGDGLQRRWAHRALLTANAASRRASSAALRDSAGRERPLLVSDGGSSVLRGDMDRPPQRAPQLAVADQKI